MSTHTAVLLISCPDRAGIVAAVAAWVTDAGGNIVHAEQHTDPQDAMFFQRVEFTHDGSQSLDQLSSQFNSAVAQRFGMTYSLRALPWRPRTAILSSKAVHCLADMLTRSKYGDLGLDIQAVISNHDDHRSLVEAFDYRFVHIPVVGNEATARIEQEKSIDALLEQLDVDVVILARYMLILPQWFAEKWSGRMINIHHSFLPSFVGANPYRQAHDRGVKIIGATAHYVSEVLDEGPIIAQDVTPVSHRDDVQDLTRRGRNLEINVLANAVRAHVEHQILMFGNRTIVFH